MSDELGAQARIAQLPPATAPPLAAAAMEGEDELNAGFDALDRMFIDSGDEGGEEAEYGSAKLEQLSENGGFGVAELELEAGAGKPQGDHEEKAPTSSLWVCGGLMSTPRQSCRQSACVCVCVWRRALGFGASGPGAACRMPMASASMPSVQGTQKLKRKCD